MVFFSLKIPVVTSQGLLNEYGFSRTNTPNLNTQHDNKKVQQSTLFILFSGFSNSVFANPYIIGLITVVITSLVGKYHFYFNKHSVVIKMEESAGGLKFPYLIPNFKAFLDFLPVVGYNWTPGMLKSLYDRSP